MAKYKRIKSRLTRYANKKHLRGRAREKYIYGSGSKRIAAKKRRRK